MATHWRPVRRRRSEKAAQGSGLVGRSAKGERARERGGEREKEKVKEREREARERERDDDVFRSRE